MTRLNPDQIKPGRSYRLMPYYTPGEFAALAREEVRKNRTQCKVKVVYP